MNKYYYEILGVTESSSDEEITAKYEELKKKYSEERFLEGEAGNEAAKMLNRIDVAYNEIMTARSEKRTAESAGSSYAKAEQLIREGKINEAQAVLDEFNERPAEWHYLQSVVFYRKNWMNESKKQLEIAMQLEPDNEKYKETYRKLNDRLRSNAQQAQAPQGGQQGVYEGQTMQSSGDEQLGGSFCSSCIQCCALNMCLNMLCNCCR